MLWTIYDAYEIFVKKHPAVKIYLSEFAKLRPSECTLTEQIGLHNGCVCMTHENARLMCKVIAHLIKIIDETDLINKNTCSKNSLNCALNKCDQCDELMVKLRDQTYQIIDDASIEKISFGQWCMTERFDQWLMQSQYYLIQTLKDSDVFVDDLFTSTCENLKIHNYVAIQQSKFLNELKMNLKNGEYVFIMDFSENYSMLIL